MAISDNPRNLSRRRACRLVGCLGLAWLGLLVSPASALAHSGEHTTPARAWSAWNWDPPTLLMLIAAAAGYATGVRALRQRHGVTRHVSTRHITSFYAGILTLFIALISPVDGVSSTLFSAHMTQHILLMMVAAPLIALGQPRIVFIWALPRDWQRSFGGLVHQPRVRAVERVITDQIAAWVLFAVVLWTWHLPGPYQAAVRHDLLHAIEHGCFFAVALLFWSSIFAAIRRGREAAGLSILYLATTTFHVSILGALLTFSSRIWYPVYEPAVPAWHLSAETDQQLGGLVMWLPAGFIFLIVIGALFTTWLRAMERRKPSGAPLPPTPGQPSRFKVDSSQQEGHITT